MPHAAVTLPDDPAALKNLVLQLQGALRAHDLLIQALRLQIARLKKRRFGASSEKVAREIEQLKLALEGLQIAQTEIAAVPEEDSIETVSALGVTNSQRCWKLRR
jgi:transposase